MDYDDRDSNEEITRAIAAKKASAESERQIAKLTAQRDEARATCFELRKALYEAERHIDRGPWDPRADEVKAIIAKALAFGRDETDG